MNAGIFSTVAIAYVLVGALLFGAFRRFDIDLFCDGEVESYAISAAVWPMTLLAVGAWRLILKPWWFRILVPLATWSAKLFGERPEASDD